MKNDKVKRLTTIAMLAALAYVSTVLIRIPVVLFLKYDPKDIVITLGGLIYGPVTALIVSVVVSLVEMVTISDTGVIGMVMNVLASCSFACTVAIFYRNHRNISGAIKGLICGCLCATAVMLLWNYLVTPIYMNVDRETVVGLLLPYILPYNLLKTSLNAVVVFLLYKPVVNSLRSIGFAQQGSSNGSQSKTLYPIIGIVALITIILLMFVLKGVI